MNKLQLFRRRLLLFFSSLAVGLLILEVILRLWGGEFNLSPNWKFHPVLGWSQIPNLKGTYKVHNEKVQFEFNSLGFRDVEHQKKKPIGTKRVVILGDSMSQAIQVNLEDTYFRILERTLNNNSDQKWEVINLSVGDFGTAQELIALKEYGLFYEPDLVVIQIFPLNDICTNSIQLFELCGSQNDRYRPYFEESNGELRITMAQPGRTWFRKNIKTYGLIERTYYEAKQLIFRKSLDELREEKRKQSGYTELPQLYTYADESQQIPPIVEGWKLTERGLDHILRLCKQKNIEVLAVVVPFEACVGNKNWSAFHKPKKGFELIKDYPEKRLKAFFDRAEVPSVMMLYTFENHVNEVLPFRGGHLNPAGHRLTAQAIIEKMKSMER